MHISAYCDDGYTIINNHHILGDGHPLDHPLTSYFWGEQKGIRPLTQSAKWGRPIWNAPASPLLGGSVPPAITHARGSGEHSCT